MLYCCNTIVDQYNREQLDYMAAAFPIACYHDDLHRDPVPWHWHDDLEVAIVTEGTAFVAIGAETHSIHAGDGFFVNSGVLHSCWTQTQADCRFHSMVFHPRLVGGGMESVFYQKYVLPVMECRTMRGMHLHVATPWQASALQAAERAWQACAQEPAYYELSVRNALSELMAIMLAHIPAPQPGPAVKGMRDAERIKGMLQFIHRQYGEQLHTAAIAESVSISESECLRCFRAVIGTTPIQYLREYRIAQAARLLMTTGERIADVAAKCGFQDVSYFTKTFREMHGCTPKEYRESAHD